MRKILLIVLVFTTSLNVSISQEVKPWKWERKYYPASRACYGDDLVVTKNTLSWQDCKNAPIKILLTNEKEMAFKVDKNSSCGLSGKLIVIYRDEEGAYPSIQSNMKQYLSNPYGHSCTYGWNTNE